MMDFKSLDNMMCSIRGSIGRLPSRIDVVVGVPRSGLIPASAIALLQHAMLTDVTSIEEGRVFDIGYRPKPGLKVNRSEWRSILLVDDSCLSGRSMLAALERVRAAVPNSQVTTCVVYGVGANPHPVDMVLDTVGCPHVFEWNMMHHHHLQRFCIDFDGVLCRDPTPSEWKDENAYSRFVATIPPSRIPRVPVGTIVTGRSDRYREQTESWLRRHNIQFQQIHFFGDQALRGVERKRAVASFKAEVYRSQCDALLFVESDIGLAEDIARISGKEVLSVDDMRIHTPSIPATEEDACEQEECDTAAPVKQGAATTDSRITASACSGREAE